MNSQLSMVNTMLQMTKTHRLDLLIFYPRYIMIPHVGTTNSKKSVFSVKENNIVLLRKLGGRGI